MLRIKQDSDQNSDEVIYSWLWLKKTSNLRYVFVVVFDGGLRHVVLWALVLFLATSVYIGNPFHTFLEN